MIVSLLRLLVALTLFAGIALPASAAKPGDVTEERLRASIGDGTNWLVKGGNARGQHFSVLAQIDAGNVSELGLAWATDIPVADGIAATPIVVDGVVYVSAAYSIVYAIDAVTGRILWSYDPGVRDSFAGRPGMSWTARASRGIAVWGGRVFAATADCRLIALDAGTGKPAWSKQTCDPERGYGISDSPYVGDGKVFVGNNGSESGQKNRGYVSAYSADSGDLLWRFYTVPSDDPAENDTAAMKMAAATWSGDALAKYGGGGSAWNEMTYDPETGLLFFGTAGALPYVWELRSPDGGDNLFTSSVIALDAGTGEYVWHYQTVPKDSWEYNATMNIALGEFEIGGRERKTLMIAPKNGFHYVLDRLTGELMAADKFAKVNWASHINLETGRPVYLPDAEYWRPDAESVVAVWPNMWGAHNWHAMAWHPELRLSYIPVIDVPDIVSDYRDGEFADTLELVTEVDGKPFSPGKLVAFDPLAGKPRWSVDHELALNGGVMATAGNLVFQGDATGRFSAYAADTGERLWSVTTGSSITAAPATYAVDGRQYVAIPIGSGGGIQFVYPGLGANAESQGPTRLLAFTLRADAVMPVPARELRTLPDQPELDATPATIAAGGEIYDRQCKGCHGKDAVARVGGSPADLRYADAATHAAWHGIVIGGAQRASGMPGFGLTVDESEAVRAYVLSRAGEIRRATKE
jgi:quinohemoprotein ethanol dehydrogenase